MDRRSIIFYTPKSQATKTTLCCEISKPGLFSTLFTPDFPQKAALDMFRQLGKRDFCRIHYSTWGPLWIILLRCILPRKGTLVCLIYHCCLWSLIQKSFVEFKWMLYSGDRLNVEDRLRINIHLLCTSSSNGSL